MKRFARLVWFVLAYDVLVVLWGAYVRASFSGDGCGSHWPLCNGEVVPHLAQTKTAVELSHRVSSGGSLVLAFIVFFLARRLVAEGNPLRRAAAWVLAFTASEALIGAALVLLRLVAHDVSLRRAVSTSMHLSNTFLLLASLAFTARAADGRSLPSLRPRGWTSALALGSLATVILVGATGSLAALGDTLYPSHSVAQGLAADVAASAPLLIRLRSLHPLLAALSSLAVLAVATVARDRWLSLAFFAQLGLGLLNITLLAPMWLQIVHLLMADVVWVLLVLAAAEVLARPVSASPAGAPEGFRPAP